MTRRLLYVVAGVVGAGLAVSACGGDDATTPASDATVALGVTPDSAADSTTAPPSSAATTVSPADPTTATTSRPATSPPTSSGASLVAAAPEDATVLITGLLGDPPPEVADPADLAELIADAFASAGDPTQVDLVSAGEPASAVITVVVRDDDSVGGVRYTISMEGDDTYGWVVSSATSENLCLRGIDGPLCV